MGQCYSVHVVCSIKDSALLVKLTNEYIAKAGNFSEDCWDKSDLTTADGCIRAFIAGDTQPESYSKEVVGENAYEYSNAFDCCYSWEGILSDWFTHIAPSLCEGSTIEVYPDAQAWRITVNDDGSVQDCNIESYYDYDEDEDDEE